MNELTQGIAVVTGAGGGLGRALSVELSKSMQVAGIGRDQAALDETQAMAEPAVGVVLRLDVGVIGT